MSLMGFQKKKYLDRGVGGWVELYPIFFWIFGIFLTLQSPLVTYKYWLPRPIPQANAGNVTCQPIIIICQYRLHSNNSVAYFLPIDIVILFSDTFFGLKMAKARRHVHFHSCSLHDFYIYM